MAIQYDRYIRWRDPIFLLLFLAGILLRAVRLSFPEDPAFDEIYYAPAAEDYLQGRPDANSVHPPLAKIQMAAVILFMDVAKTAGFIDFQAMVPSRMSSLLAGIGILWLTHRLAYTLSGRPLLANLSLFLVSADFLSIVQSRIAMLDQIQAFWILAGFVFTAEVLFEKKGRDHVAFAALCFGVATACKWNGLFAAAGAWLALMGGVYPQSAPPGEFEEDYERPYPQRSWGKRVVCTLMFLVCGVVVYIAAYTPFFISQGSAGKESFEKIVGFHKRMVKFRYDPEQFKHRYLSQFYEWPLVLRPVWYYYVDTDKVVRGIVGIGNVIFWWPAFFLILESLWLGYRGSASPGGRSYDRLAQFACCFYFPQWVLWKSSTTGGFFYYMIGLVPIMAIAMGRHLEELFQEGKARKSPDDEAPEKRFNPWGSRTLAWFYLALVTVSLILYYPLLTGLPVDDAYFRKLFFVDRWI